LASRIKLYIGIGHGRHHAKEGKDEEDLHDRFCVDYCLLGFDVFALGV
jgi:hypothetical protein